MILDPSDLQALNEAHNRDPSKPACHAPFKGMHLSHGGKMYICGFNRNHLLGTWPEQTVLEAWFGRAGKEIREAMSNNDFSYGCQNCYKSIKARNFAGLPAKDYDKVHWSPFGYPTKMDFELSNTCNLECVMCNGMYSSSIRKNREKRPEIPVPYNSKLIDQLDDFIPHLQNSHCLGGEPFLIPLYYELWDRMIQLNPKIEISVQTNGTIYNNRVMHILENLAFTIAVSIDSIDKKNYESIRHNGNFERVMENLDYFISHCHSKGRGLSISWCLMAQNYHELPDLIEFCNEKGITVFFNTVHYPPEFSVRYQSVKFQDDVIAFLEKYTPPQGEHIQDLNARSYIDAVNLVRYWRRLTLDGKNWEHGMNEFQNMDEMYRELREYINRTEEGEIRQKAIYDDVCETIELLLGYAREDGLIEPAIQCLLALDLQVTKSLFGHEDKNILYPLFKSRLEKAVQRTQA